MKRKYLNIFWISGLLLLTCAYYNTFYNAEQFFKKAEKEREKRIEDYKKNKNIRSDVDPERLSGNELQNYDKAIEKASKVLELYPKSKYVDDALILLGQCFYYKKDNQKALRKFQELIENYPESDFFPQAQLWLARTYVQMANYDEAKQVFHDITTSRAPREIRDEALLAIGELYFVKEDYVTAAHEYRTAVNNIKDKTHRSRAAFQMGECYFKLKDYEKAIEAYKLALKYSTDVDTENEALFQLAQCHKLLLKYDEAMSYLQKLLGREAYREEWPMVKIEMANCIYLKDKQAQKMSWDEMKLQNRKTQKGDFYLAEEWYYAIIEDHPRTEGAARAYYYLAEINKTDYAEYDSAYAYYLRVREQNSRSMMVDSANAKADDIIEFLSLVEVVKQQENIKFNKNYRSDYDFYDANLDMTMMDDSTRYKLRKAKALRRLKKWLFDNIEIRALPDSLIADSLFADSLGMVDSLWVRDESGRLVQRNYYDQFDNQEFETEETEEERRLRQQKETLTRKLAPKIKELEKNDLIQNKTLLAEEYLFNFNQPDSALRQYQGILENFPDSLIHKMKPQILYTLNYIYRNVKKNNAVSDSLLNILAYEFPHSPQGNEARNILKLPQLENKTDYALELFQSAENEYLNNSNIEIAIQLYQKVESNYPESEYAAKSLYAAAWLYDHVLNENETAKQLYQELVQKYAATNFAKPAQKKLDAIENEKKRLLAAAREDSIRKAQPDSLLASSDSTGLNQMVAASDSTQLADLSPSTTSIDSAQAELPAATPSEEVLLDSDGILRTEPRRPSMLLFAREQQ